MISRLSTRYIYRRRPNVDKEPMRYQWLVDHLFTKVTNVVNKEDIIIAAGDSNVGTTV